MSRSSSPRMRGPSVREIRNGPSPIAPRSPLWVDEEPESFHERQSQVRMVGSVALVLSPGVPGEPVSHEQRLKSGDILHGRNTVQGVGEGAIVGDTPHGREPGEGIEHDAYGNK